MLLILPVSGPTSPTPTPAARFASIIDNLCAALAARMAKYPALRPLLLLAWTRLRRASARFTHLAARAEAGTLPPGRPRSPRPPRNPASRRRPALRLPRGYAWLIRLVPEAAAFGSQLQHLLSEPEMQALLATAPRAARTFRPLCRALAAHPIPPLPAPPLRAAPPSAALPPAAKLTPRPTAPPAARDCGWPAPGLGSFLLPKPVRTRPA